MKKPKSADRRVPDDEQPIALAAADAAGTLPDVDRRAEPAPDPAPAPPVPDGLIVYPIP